MNLQRIHLKLFVDAPETPKLDGFLPIFARWREDPSRWIDLADYAHVPKGPGIMIIGHQGNLALDLGDPGPGILYGNKSGLSGNSRERILETFRRSLALVEALGQEPEYPPELAPRPGFWQLTFNDRLETPNSEETHRTLLPSITSALDHLFGHGDYSLVRESDPLRRYGFLVHSDGVDRLDALKGKL